MNYANLITLALIALVSTFIHNYFNLPFWSHLLVCFISGMFLPVLKPGANK